MSLEEKRISHYTRIPTHTKMVKFVFILYTWFEIWSYVLPHKIPRVHLVTELSKNDVASLTGTNELLIWHKCSHLAVYSTICAISEEYLKSTICPVNCLYPVYKPCTFQALLNILDITIMKMFSQWFFADNKVIITFTMSKFGDNM